MIFYVFLREHFCQLGLLKMALKISIDVIIRNLSKSTNTDYQYFNFIHSVLFIAPMTFIKILHPHLRMPNQFLLSKPQLSLFLSVCRKLFSFRRMRLKLNVSFLTAS